MKAINTALLLILADSVLATETRRFGTELVGTQDSFALKLKAEVDKRQEDAEKAAASVIVDTIEIKNAIILANAQRVASLQDQITQIQKSSQDLATAEAYGFNTRNFLPLALLTGQSAPVGAKKDQLSFPKGWEVPAPVAPVAPAA